MRESIFNAGSDETMLGAVTAESGYGSLGGGGGRAGPCSSTRPDAGLPLPDRGDDGHYYLGSNRFPRWACTTAPIVGLFTRRLGDRSVDTDTVIMQIRPRAVFAGTISAIAVSYKKYDSTTSPEAGYRFLTFAVSRLVFNNNLGVGRFLLVGLGSRTPSMREPDRSRSRLLIPLVVTLASDQ